ncbi:MAG: PepSY-like domain-containing protein [Paludibacter sp.]|nr:PepSY-like domain-containing protein [Bacteroidales bacterium]MCM1068346.1 PepSY-like domain-containing protein [Prevotella sp.]MCM1354026.1 PepSY-like domain-containing protein [Bacteroides sp.]MCM1442132.1 PepSY-like domain-containing protein [Muribaculum sp.]MCM1481975.1 PepSY-like domain-containing protein [Paludibacter sp.]
MKKMLSVMCMTLLFCMNSCTAQEKIISFEQLPAAAQNVITTYFSVDNISYITSEKELSHTDYEVKFIDGSSVDFNTAGEVEKVESKFSAVPDGLVPAKIRNYVQTKFANNFITEYKKEWRKYEIELNNGLDLIFNKNMDFVGIDD